MVASRETLQDLAAERQLQPATLERVIRLIDILDAFGADTLIGPRVALKGGTALNVFHSDLDRLSVDIDLNYVGAIEKERMDAARPGLEDRIERLMESKGYAARRGPSEHAGGKWIYRYASALGGAGTIEIDINYLFRVPLYGVDRMPSTAIGSYRATNVPVLDIHEIVAGKMVALVTRRAARDLFDAHRIIAMPGLDWTKIKAAMSSNGPITSSCTSPPFVPSTMSRRRCRSNRSRGPEQKACSSSIDKRKWRRGEKEPRARNRYWREILRWRHLRRSAR